MTPQDFIRKWKPVALTERASAQEHFLDLCRVFDHPTPAEDDPVGDHFTFEKGAPKTGGGEGWADVWKKGFFAWEYKKKKRDLSKALEQLTRYAAALENPPLHVACDTHIFRIETRWTNEVPAVYEFELDDLAEPINFAHLRAVFHNPDELRSGRTRAKLTKEAADKFQTISDSLQHRNPDREAVAHFVNQLVFCFFADSVKLLPNGLWKKLLQAAERKPGQAKAFLARLFDDMAKGGDFDLENILEFDGGLFDGRPPLALEHPEIGLLFAAASLDWSLIDPTIFGTLFERFLDPDKRAQIGAHYTDPEKIMMIVEPVVFRLLRAEWETAKVKIEAIMAPVLAAASGNGRAASRDLAKRFDTARAAAEIERDAFIERLCALRILDPACGSGNFLYLALQGVKDIEWRAILDCEALGLGMAVPRVGPEILRGIEINPFAAELARTTIWIGDIQWRVKNAIAHHPRPILRKLDSIECRDALLSPDGKGGFVEAEWPEADFIVGNPPFLGNKKMIRELSEPYVTAVRSLYRQQLPRAGDLVCFWFAKAWEMIEAGRLTRAGFVATNSIRSGSSNEILGVISERGRIFEAWDDEPWVVEGAALRVSLVGFDGGGNTPVHLDGLPVPAIHSNLTAGQSNVTQRMPLLENVSVCFVGVILNGEFEIPGALARELLSCPGNENGRPNADVIRPTLNGDDFNGNRPDKWVIDFGTSLSEVDAALYERPFALIEKHVKPFRQRRDADGKFVVRAKIEREVWWRHARPRPKMRRTVAGLERYIATPMVSSYRIFDYLPTIVLPDQKLVMFSRDDDAFLGILQSRLHHLWTVATCSWIGAGNDVTYSNTAVFETFPFPEGLTPNVAAADYADDSRAERIAGAAKRLDDLRRAWLNPPDLVDIVPEVTPTAALGEPPRRYPDRIVPKTAEAAAKLKERTLTNLYNQRPRWLGDAHEALDRAVAAAYGWPEDISTDDALARLLALNLERAKAQEAENRL